MFSQLLLYYDNCHMHSFYVLLKSLFHPGKIVSQTLKIREKSRNMLDTLQLN